jgi:hypothetical protein
MSDYVTQGIFGICSLTQSSKDYLLKIILFRTESYTVKLKGECDQPWVTDDASTQYSTVFRNGYCITWIIITV